MPFSRDNDRYYWYCSTSRAVSEMVPYKQRILAYNLWYIKDSQLRVPAGKIHVVGGARQLSLVTN